MAPKTIMTEFLWYDLMINSIKHLWQVNKYSYYVFMITHSLDNFINAIAQLDIFYR